jgi:hypothetical protein
MQKLKAGRGKGESRIKERGAEDKKPTIAWHGIA